MVQKLGKDEEREMYPISEAPTQSYFSCVILSNETYKG